MGNKLLVIFLVLSTRFCSAQTPITSYQHNLSKLVTVEIKQQRVGDVLQQIGKAGNFYFAFNGALFGQDSIVNLNVKNMPVREVLDKLFDGKVAYKENDKYVILRYAVNHFTIEADNITTAENLYLISGHVVDTKTGKKVKEASVYDKRLLQSTLTDDDGFFTLRFKGEHQAIILTASKETYRDTALVFLSSIQIKPKGYDDPDREKGTFFSNTIEELGIGKFFISSRQRIQNINIPNFLANTPFQASLTPGLSSHGMMSSKVINKFSLNVLGGYTAGVDGFEIAGLFNLTKGDVKSVQIAGLLNVVGRNQTGFQLAGLVNSIENDAAGFQMAGLMNRVKHNLAAVQIAGLGNVVSKNSRGIQVASFGNIVSRNMRGMQIGGFGNIVSREARGAQLSLLFNYAKSLRGFQIGLVNIADTSDGFSLGLINLIKNGYHKVSVSTNELINANIALKTGNANLYTILLGGKNFEDTAKITTFGLGFGHDFIFSKNISVATELSAQQLHLGNWDYSRILGKFQTNLQIQLFKGFSIFGGPTYNYYMSKAPAHSSAPGYKQQIVPAHHHVFKGNPGWLGFSAGITIL